MVWDWRSSSCRHSRRTRAPNSSKGLAQAAETEPSLTVRRALVRAAAGIPMVLELLFRDWQTNGDRCLALSVGAMTADAIEAGTEGAYRQILDRVVGDLDDISRAVLNLASILGARLNDLPMYQLVDLSLLRRWRGWRGSPSCGCSGTAVTRSTFGTK